jgi:hypothetical protein
MEKKKTALDILFQEIKESKSFLPDNLFDYLEMVYNKAKQMEKEQKRDSFNESRLTNPMIGFKHNNFEQYYNETFKQQDK